MADQFFDNMDDVLAELQRQNALPDFTNPAALSGLEQGRDFENAEAASSLNQIRTAAKKAYDAGLESRAMWNKVESKLRQQGYRMVIRRSPRGQNEFEIFAVPDNLSDKKRHNMDVLTKFPNIVWSGVDNSGLSSRYGQRAIDQGRLDYIDGALAFYTSSTQQAQAILNRLTNPHGGATKFTDYARLARNAQDKFVREMAQRHIKSSIANAERHANAGYNAVNSYQTDDLWKMMQGTGTARSIAQRKSLTSIQPMINSILNSSSFYKSAIQAYGRANPSRQLNSQQFKARAEQDIFNTLYWYLQNRAVESIESELTEAARGGWGAGYLWNNQALRKVLQNAGRQLHGLGADVGLTSESSANQMMINLLRHGDIDIHGSLGDKAGRKLMQTAQIRQRQQKAQAQLQAALQSGGLYGKRRIYTGWEQANGLNMLAEEQAQASVMFATAEEIRKAQEKLKRGSGANVGYGSLPHGGGVFYSKALGATLDSQQQRSYSVSADTFTRAYNRLLGKLVDPNSRGEAVSRGVRALGKDSAAASAFAAWMGGYDPKIAIDIDKFRKDLEGQAFFDQLNKALRHQASRDILRKEKGVDLRAISDIAPVIERDPMGKSRVTIEWLEKHAMRSGEKLLGGQAHFVKGRGKEIEDFVALAEQIWLGRGMDQATAARLAQTVGMLMLPENLSARNVDAFLSSFLHQATRALGGPGGSPKALENFIGNINTTVNGKQWLVQKGGDWVTQFDRFARQPGTSTETMRAELEAYVGQLKAALGAATKEVTDTTLKSELRMLSEAIKVDADHNLSYDYQKFIGATTVGQHAAFDYGDPGSAVVKGDYRLIGALSRGILRSTLGGKASPEYARALLGQRSRSAAPNGQYAWQLDLDANGKIINAGQFGGTAASRQAHEQWVQSLAAVNRAKDWMNTKGATWQVADWMTKGNSDIVLGSGDLDTFLQAHGVDPSTLKSRQRKALAARYLDVSGLSKDSFRYAGEYDEGHMSSADYAASFGRLAELEKNTDKSGQLLFVPLTNGVAGASFGKQLVTGAIALPRMDSLGGVVETLLDNGHVGYDIPEPLRVLPSLISSQQDVWAARTQPNWSMTPDEAAKAFNETALANIGRMVASVESKNGSVWQAGNKAELYHSAIRHATAPDVSTKGVWGDLADVAHRMSTDDLAAMLRRQDHTQSKEQYLEQLRTQYYYLWSNLVENPADLDTKWAGLKGYKGGAYRYLLDAVTRGTDAFNERAALAKDRGVQLHGLSGFGIRFPLSNAEDTRAADIFADPDLLKDEIQVALGAGAGQNLDWDGDTYATVLAMLGTADPAERARLIEQMGRQNAVDSALMRRQADAFRAQFGKELESGVSLASIFNEDAQEISAVKSRLNKGFTGRFSNQFQALSEALSFNEAWADRDTPLNAEERKEFLQNQVARMLLESFTQDAISSKKVRKRIESSKYGKTFASNASFLSDLDKLYDLIQDSQTYSGPEAIRGLIKRGQDLEILGKDSLFDWRLTSQFLAKLDQYGDDEAAAALGMTVDEIRALKADRTGNLGLSPETVARILGQVNARVKAGTGFDIGHIIRDKINRPGGIDAESNPVYRVGTDVGTTADYERVKAANAGLADAAAQVGAFGEAVQKAAKQVDDAGQAVEDSAAAVKKGPSLLGNIEYAMKHHRDSKAVAVTKLAGAMVGEHFASDEDRLAFEDALIAAGAESPTAISALAGYDAERFKSLRTGSLTTRRGTIIDSIEQLFNTIPGIDWGQVHTIDDLIKMANDNPELRNELYKYDPAKHEEGLGIILGRSIEGLSEDVLAATQRNHGLWNALLGSEQADAFLNQRAMAGLSMGVFFRGLADRGNEFLGHEFGVVGANGPDASAAWNHGRIDVLMKSTTQVGDKTVPVLDIFDKKSVDDYLRLGKSGPSLKYAAQVATYAEDLRQMAAYAKKTQDLGQLQSSDYYKAWLDKGGTAIDENLYKLLRDPDLVIRAALTYADANGNIRNYNIGNGLFGDRDFLRRLAGYAMQGTPEEKWEAGDAATIKKMMYRDDRGMAMGGAEGPAEGPALPSAPAMAKTGLLGSMGKNLGAYVGRILGGSGLYRLFAKVRQGIASLVKEATELDKTLTNLQITTGGTREDTRQLLSTYAELGRQLGATTQEVAASALEWQRQGYEAGEVADLVTSSLYLSKLGMIDASTATQNLTSALKGFKIAASESMDVVDKLTAIDLKAATSAGEIANGLAQFANIGSLSGVNIDEAAAYVATIADVTQMSGSSAGQALECFWRFIGIIHNPISKIFSND